MEGVGVSVGGAGVLVAVDRFSRVMGVLVGPVRVAAAVPATVADIVVVSRMLGVIVGVGFSAGEASMRKSNPTRPYKPKRSKPITRKTRPPKRERSIARRASWRATP
jgi:hypothetical protein